MTRVLQENVCVGDEVVVAFLRGRLGPDAVRSLDRHVASCASCRELVSALAQTLNVSVPAIGRDDPGAVTPGFLTEPDGEPELAVGTTIGRFVIADRLGAGGMAVVYAAHDPELQRKVAIKVLRREGLDASAQKRLHERLRREAQAMARLAHPNVVSVHDVGLVDERIFIAMELVEGQTFGGWLAETKRGWREIVAKLRPAGEGLAAAHAAGLVLLDFKPENVLVGKDGRVRVADFGLARAFGTGELPGADPAASTPPPLRQTATGAIGGTPYYMAPEQFLGLATDARTDQFSFCLALYVAIVGEHPFARGDEGVEGLADAVRHGRLRPPPRPDPLPRWLRRVLVRGMATEPADRYLSMKELLAALARDRRRRLLVAASVAVPVLALVAGGVLASRSSAGDARLLCQGGERKWTGVWDAQRAAAVEKAFAASGKPYAARTFASLRAELDTYVQDWTHSYTDACEAARVRGTESEEMLDRRMICLDARLGEARALTDACAGDPAAVEKASRWLESLGDVAECGDTRALAEQVPPPKDAETRARVASLRARLAAYDYGGYGKRESKAAQEVAAVVEEARATGYRPIEAEALFNLSMKHKSAGDFKQAIATQEKGIWAAEASHFDKVAAKSWVNLMMFKAEASGAFDDALALTPRVTSLLERMGGDPEVEGLLHLARANILQFSSKYPEALEEAAKGRASCEKLADKRPLLLAQALGTQANILFDMGRIVEAHENYDRVLDIKMTMFGDQHPEVAMAYQDIGTAQSVETHHKDAIASMLKAEGIFAASLDENHPARAVVAHNLALAHEAIRDYKQAVSWHRRAIAVAAVAHGKDHPTYAAMLSSLAGPLAELHRFEEALAALDEALAVQEKTLGPVHMRIAYTVGHQAEIFLEMRKFAQARAKAERGVTILEKTIGPQAADVRSFLLLLGGIDVAAGQPARALPTLERALAFGNKEGDPGDFAQIQFALAQALVGAHKDPARARALAEAARATLAQDPRHASELAEVDAWLKRHRRISR